MHEFDQKNQNVPKQAREYRDLKRVRLGSGFSGCDILERPVIPTPKYAIIVQSFSGNTAHDIRPDEESLAVRTGLLFAYISYVKKIKS